MSSSVRTGIAIVLACATACTEAPTAPVASAAPTAPDASARFAVRPFVAVTIGDLGGGSAVARNINSIGVVVGSSMTAGGEVHAFVWMRGRGMLDLGTLRGDDRSDALAVNLLGEAVGTSGSHAVRWDRNGRIRRLPAPGAERSAATDINVGGVVSGWVVYPPAGATPRRQLPATWSRAGSLTVLDVPEPRHEGEAVAVNDRGMVAATVGSDIAHGTRAALWRRGSGWRMLEPQLPDGRAVDVNLGGDVVGVDLGQPFNPPPMLWRRDGSLHNLSPRGGDVRGINLLGQMAGRAVLEENGFRLPVMWGHDLSPTPLPVPENVSSVVNALSDLGEVVGGVGADAVIWTRYPATIRGAADVVAASRAAATGDRRTTATPSLPGWLVPEHERCTRAAGPLQPGEPICGRRR